MAHHLAMQFSDLSLESLARLEAKLLADVEVVRRMRVLLEEHQAVWEKGAPAGGVAAATVAGVPAASAVPAVPVESKPLEERAVECLLALPGETFVVEDLRRGLRKRGANPKEATLKTLMNRLMRQGTVVVQELRKGRGGSLYRCTLPQVSAEKAAVPSAESPPSPPEEGTLPPVS